MSFAPLTGVMEPPRQLVLAPFGTDPRTGLPNEPHETQLKIFQWVKRALAGEFKGIPVLYVQHGVNSGGTRGCLNPVIYRLMKEPGLRVLIGRKDFNDLRLSTMETFLDVMYPFIADRDSQEHRYVIAGENGPSTVFFRELKDVRGLGSQEFGCIMVTEAHEIDLHTLHILKQRARQDKFQPMVILEGNPPNEGHWLLQLTDPFSANYDADVTMFKMPSYENWPNMTEAYQESLERMPPTLKRRYVLGEAGFIPSGTPVYPAFVEQMHVRPVEILEDRPIIRGWDFGWRKAACVWAQLSDGGQLRVLKEWMAIETPEDAFIDGVKMRTTMWFGDTVCKDFGDPAATQRDREGKSTLQRLMTHGINMLYKQTQYADRIPLINKRLSMLVNGEPATVVDPYCRTIIEGFLGGYHFPEMKPDTEMTQKKEIPMKDGWYEHLCLHGDTKVRTVSGWKPIRELVGKSFITYSYSDEEKRLVPSIASNVRMTAPSVVVWKLVHDGGELIATPDHLIMRRDGTYSRLDELKAGDSLMPFYDRTQARGHHSLQLNDGSIVYEHQYIWTHFRGHLKRGMHIHHIDANPSNNDPANLEQVDAKEHMREVYDRMRVHPKWKDARRSERWTEDAKHRVSIATRARWAAERKPKLCVICKKGYEGGIRQKYCSPRCRERSRYTEFKHVITPRLKQPQNHAVISVEPWGVADVYDMTVEKHHNYPANGIIVHNCNALEYVFVNVFSPSPRAIENFMEKKRIRERRIMRLQTSGAVF